MDTEKRFQYGKSMGMVMIHAALAQDEQTKRLIALKTMLYRVQFSAPGDCCPICGGHQSHDAACCLAALIDDESAEKFKQQVGMTAVDDMVIEAELIANQKLVEESYEKPNGDSDWPLPSNWPPEGQVEQQEDETAFPCLKCGKEADEIHNIGRDHWGVCLDCRVTWAFGGNLFSSWKDETEADWEANRQYLSQFEMIDDNPILPDVF